MRFRSRVALCIAGPYIEAATALYVVTALVMTMSPESNPVVLFRMLLRFYS
jgi:hypothetical protein